MVKKNNLICQGNCICFKFQITILNSHYANDKLTFSKQHPSHALPYNWKHHQIQTYFSIDQPKSSQKKDEFFILKNSFFFFLLLLCEWYIHPTIPIPQSQKEKRTVFGKGLWGRKIPYCPDYSLWNSDKEQLVDKEGPVSTKTYISK